LAVLTTSFLICIAFISSPCIISLAKTMLNKNG
jgi:hypothetical protein